MNATTAAIDLAKNVFQVALADSTSRVLEQHRLTRSQFDRFFDNRSVARVIMEACGSAHHWARVLTRPPARSPTRWRASATRCCATKPRSVSRGPGLARKCSAHLLSWRTDQPFPIQRCVETIRPIMATSVAPQPNHADNPAGSPPYGHTAAGSDWHWVGRFHVGTSHNSQRSLKMPDIRLQALPFAINFEFVLILGGSPYTKG